MLPAVIAQQLRNRGHDVVAVAELLELRGLPDDELFDHAQRDGRAIVTYNRDDFLTLDDPLSPGGPRSSRHRRPAPATLRPRQPDDRATRDLAGSLCHSRTAVLRLRPLAPVTAPSRHARRGFTIFTRRREDGGGPDVVRRRSSDAGWFNQPVGPTEGPRVKDRVRAPLAVVTGAFGEAEYTNSLPTCSPRRRARTRTRSRPTPAMRHASWERSVPRTSCAVAKHSPTSAPPYAAEPTTRITLRVQELVSEMQPGQRPRTPNGTLVLQALKPMLRARRATNLASRTRYSRGYD